VGNDDGQDEEKDGNEAMNKAFPQAANWFFLELWPNLVHEIDAGVDVRRVSILRSGVWVFYGTEDSVRVVTAEFYKSLIPRRLAISS